MPRLPLVSGADAVKAFKKAGWRIDRVRGRYAGLRPGPH